MNNNHSSLKLLSISLVLLLSNCNLGNKQNSNNDDYVSTNSNNYSLLLFRNSDKSWGYKIKDKGEIIIDQPNIPAIQSNKGFPDSLSALRIGNLMVEKMKNGIFPPGLKPEEVDSILYLDLR